jgi:uncharacterized protein YdeI (YjbR/CyaY-like superfamily)
MPPDELPVITFASAEEWEAWLEAHHASAGGVWIRYAKAGSGIESVSYREAVRGALRYGWIDGQSKSIDERHWMQRFTPRRPRSRWSRVNREAATAMIERGEVAPAGLREVERAKADGRWDAAYDSPSTATVPEDLRRALDESPAASAAFEALDGQNRYAILHRVQTAKKPETRARRIEKFVAMLAEGGKLHP